MKRRKYIRIALNEADQVALDVAKVRTQKQTGIRMSDSMFVLSLVRQAISK